MRSLPTLPTGHPYYDKAADKIELLPPDQVQQITQFYNLVTSARMAMAMFKSADFQKLRAEQQNPSFVLWADLIEREFGAVRDVLLPELRKLADGKPWYRPR